jgi:23S rRNA (uracil1939-C5)-methyltransferase
MGFYQKHTNRIIPFAECQAESELSNEIVSCVKGLLEKLHCAGQVRHLLIKHAHATGQVMVVLIVRNRLKEEKKIADVLSRQFPSIVSIQELINRRTDNVILDGETVLLKGKPYIEEVLLGCTFRISARSFYQINPYTTPLLYTEAIEAAGLTGREVLVDLYCGTGTMGIIASSKAKKVYGIEIVPDAVKDARINAEINHVNNIEFMTADANQGARRIIRSKLKVDAMIVDPPRKGCTPDTLDAIVRISPQRLVYVSCDPATLARDVKILSGSGYELQFVQPVDMFPGTFHVESIVCFQRNR